MNSIEIDDWQNESHESFRDALKRRLCQIYFELMKERQMRLPFAVILMVIMSLQFIGYMFYRKTNFPFEDGMHDTISEILDVIRIYPAIESAKSTELYVTTIIIMVLYVLLYIVNLIFIDYSIGIGKFYFRFPIVILGNMSSLLIWILIGPITETMVSVFDCNGDYHQIMESTKCWEGIHIIAYFLWYL